VYQPVCYKLFLWEDVVWNSVGQQILVISSNIIN